MKRHIYVTIDKKEFYKWLKNHDMEIKDVAEIEGISINSIYAHLKESRLPTTTLSKILDFVNIIDMSLVDLPFIADMANDILRNFQVKVRDGSIYGDMLTSIRTYISYKYDEIRMHKEFSTVYGCFLPTPEKKPEPPKFAKEDFDKFVEKIKLKIFETQNVLTILNAKLKYLEDIEPYMPLEKLEIEVKNMRL